MIVFASPVYYFGATAQLAAAIQRVFCIGKPVKARNAALLLSSSSPNTGRSVELMYKDIVVYTGIEDLGICAPSWEENKAEEKHDAIRVFAKGL